jgi:DNA-binding transcriptional LysR family regulator
MATPAFLEVPELAAAVSRPVFFARGILLACNAVKADLRAISAPRALRVGVLQTLSTRHVADLLGAFRRTRPEIVLQLVDAARDELETRLDQEKLDVILTSLAAADQRKNAVVLFKEPYVLAVSLDHRFAKLKSITLKDQQRTLHCSHVLRDVPEYDQGSARARHSGASRLSDRAR